MSNINDKATVSLFVNGEQAEEAMDRLRKKAADLDKQLQSALAAGDKKTANRLQRELDKVNKELNRAETAAKGVGVVLNNLSNTSIHGLRNALKFLEKQLRMTKPNSEAWHRYAEQIAAVKSRINELNEELEGGTTLWDKFKSWAEDTWPAIDLLSKGYDAAIGFMREYVDAYASMDQEMANVRKFTGMTSEQVAALNEEFKKIDTRTSREDLNKLAQEAGRLGKTSQEDVLGFVRAADKINVALDDLGEGATLTLSKLTGIFGYEAKFGTEQSLLKVGSVINELSQNCSASAPYLAEFTQRLGGVGAQARMSIPQIMGFAAVLDSNAMAVEASSTALSQVIVRMMQEPAKYAKVAGLDVKKFTDMLKTDVNGALILFLETLQKAGGMDVLSPMFKDMGENGSRAIAALSTLATHIDEVKKQQNEANIAFREGTSIDKEFDVQNNTVQASIEKAKKRFQELRIELGEKLSPLMAYIISSTSAMAKAVSLVVDFCLKYKTIIILLTTAIGSYYVAVGLATVAQKAWTAAVVLGRTAITAFKYTVGLCQVAMIALTHGTKAAGTAFTFLNQTMKANPFGLVIALVATLTVAISRLFSKTDDYNSKMKESVQIAYKYNEQMEKEQNELDKLVGALEGATEGTEEYEKAKDSLLSKYGAYLEGLVTEEGKIIDLEKAYIRLSEAIRIANEERGIEEARKAVDDTYFEQMSTLQKQLTVSLIAYGADQREAARLAMQVSTAMSANRKISDEAIARLNELSRNTPNASAAHGFLANLSPASQNSVIGELFGVDQVPQPAAVVNSMYDAKDVRNTALNEVDIIQREQRPYGELIDGMLESMISYAQAAVDNNGGAVLKMTDELAGVAGFVEVTADEARALLTQLQGEMAYRKGSAEDANAEPTVPTAPTGDGYQSQTVAEREAKKKAAEERREAAKAKREFKEELNSYKAQRTAADREILELYKSGQIDYETMLSRIHDNELKYYDDSLAHFESTFADQKDTYLQDDKDYQKLLSDRQKADEKYEENRINLALRTISRRKKAEERDAQHEYDIISEPTLQNEIDLQAKLYSIRRTALDDELDLYTIGSKEYADVKYKIEELEQEKELSTKKLYFQAVNALRKQYDKKSATERYHLEKATLDALLRAEILTAEQYAKYLKALTEKYKKELPGDKDSGSKASWTNEDQQKYDADKKALEDALASNLITQADYYRRVGNLDQEVREKQLAGMKQYGGEWNSMLADVYLSFSGLFNNIGKSPEVLLGNLANCVSAVTSVVSAGMQIATQFAKAESEIQLAAIEKRYDHEIELAQGNSYKVAKLEKRKEKETAKIKNEASKKQYAMQVVQALAQSLVAGLNAYSSTLAIPIIGPALAPAAMAVALAMGATQVALLKKQQQAAEAQGYSKGGFTKPGAVDEPAGIVHAGEWVASQKLLANPVARPMIEALDYAQRTNTIGSLRPEDVSRSITANDSLVRMAEGDGSSALMVAAAVRMSQTVDALTDRLNEPFVTVNTVVGDKGIKQAQDEYSRLMDNVTPKSKRK